MRRLLIPAAAVLLGLAVGFGGNRAGGSVNVQGGQTPSAEIPFELKIESEHGQHLFRNGEKIRLRVTLTNSSNRDLVIGRDFWEINSVSTVKVILERLDGPQPPGEGGGADGVDGNRSLAEKMLENWILLPPQYSYSSGTYLGPGLAAGKYRVYALFKNSGVEWNSSYNPLDGEREEAAEKYRKYSWKGVVRSNDLRITMTSSEALTGKP